MKENEGWGFSGPQLILFALIFTMLVFLVFGIPPYLKLW